MFKLIIGIIIGLFFKPILWHILKKLIFPPTASIKQKLLPVPQINNGPENFFFHEALKENKELAWLNLLIIKWYQLARESHYFNEKMKQLILKKFYFFIQLKIIKNVEIKKLIFNDCPFVKKIKVLKEEDFCKIREKLNVNEEFEEDCFKKHILYLSRVVFSGIIGVELRILVPGGLVYNLEVVLKEFEGDVIVRLPSLNHLTRFDACFLRKPNFQFQFGEDNVSIRYLKRVFLYFLNQNVVFPTWLSFYIPMVVPNLKEITHPTFKIDIANFKKVCEEVKETILIYTSLDYKITKKTKDFLKRRWIYPINGKKLIRFDLNLPERENFLDSISELTLFKGILPNFIVLKQIKTLDDQCSLIVTYFTNATYQFLRIKSENFVIFQSLENAEFICFEIKLKVLFIYQYNISKNLELTDKRIERIFRKINDKQSKTLGSTKLHTFISKSKAKVKTLLKKENINFESRAVNLQVPLHKKLFESIKITNMNSFFKRKIKIDFEILKNSFIRLEIFGGNILAQSNFENKMYSTVLAGKNKDFMINTLEESDLIIDTDQQLRVLIYKKGEKDVEIFSKEEFSNPHFIKFVNFVKIETNLRSITFNDEYIQKNWQEKFEFIHRAERGSLGFELSNKADTNISISIYDKSNETYIIRNLKLPLQARFLIVFPTSYSDYIFTFKTSSRYNQFSKLRIIHLEKKEFFLVTEAYLEPKKELELIVRSEKDSFVHWRTPNNLQVSLDLLVENEKLQLVDCNLFKATNAKYHFIYRNNNQAGANFKVFLCATELKE